MSTKTLRKRIALVAVAALGFGVVTGVSANAVGAANITVNAALSYGAASQSNTATQAIGNQVIFSFDTNSAATQWYITSDTATTKIVSAAQTAGVATTLAGINSLNYDNGITYVADTNARVLQVGVTSTAAGTAKIKVQTLSATTGVYTTTASLTITWLDSAATAGISSTYSYAYPIAAGGSCAAVGGSHAADMALAAAVAKSRIVSGGNINVCIVARNGADQQIGFVDAGSYLTTSLGGSFDVLADADGAYQTGAFAAAQTGSTGDATITVTLTDALGNIAVLNTKINVYGSLASLTLDPYSYAAYAAVDQTNDYAGVYNFANSLTAASTTKTMIVGITGKDSTGNKIDLNASAPTSIGTWTVDSDKTAGTPVDRTSDALAAAVVQTAGNAGELSSTSFGTNVAFVNCGIVPEKLTLTAWAKDALGAWVKSNSLAVYCSGATSKVDVTVSGNSVNVNVTDANGYPVADGTSVTLAASNGSVVAPSSKSTVNGKFSTAATFIPNSTATSSSVTAIVGSKSGTSAAVAGSGNSVESQVAATQTQIADLISKINALSKLIAKIQKKLGVK